MYVIYLFIYFYFTLYPLRIVAGETRIGIFANRDIRKGEPLTYDYQYELLLNSLVASLSIALPVTDSYCSFGSFFLFSLFFSDEQSWLILIR